MDNMVEPINVKRPGTSGPGSDEASWKAYAAALTGKPAEDFADMKRAEVIEFVEKFEAAADGPVKEAPEGVKPTEKARHKDAKGRPTWSVPVEGGFVAEHVLVKAERERTKAAQVKAQKAQQG